MTITSQIKPFTNDSVLYRNIHNQIEQIILKNDLDAIYSWAEKWLMKLNINNKIHISMNLFIHHYLKMKLKKTIAIQFY